MCICTYYYYFILFIIFKLKPVMHSLVQAYTDPKEENRDILEQLGSIESPHIGTSVTFIIYMYMCVCLCVLK